MNKSNRLPITAFERVGQEAELIMGREVEDNENLTVSRTWYLSLHEYNFVVEMEIEERRVIAEAILNGTFRLSGPEDSLKK